MDKNKLENIYLESKRLLNSCRSIDFDNILAGAWQDLNREVCKCIPKTDLHYYMNLQSRDVNRDKWQFI